MSCKSFCRAEGAKQFSFKDPSSHDAGSAGECYCSNIVRNKPLRDPTHKDQSSTLPKYITAEGFVAGNVSCEGLYIIQDFSYMYV